MGSAVAERPRILDEEGNLLNRPVQFIHHASFEESVADEVIPEESDALEKSPADQFPPARTAALDEQQERHLFRQMNYRFFRAELLRQQATQRGLEAGQREEFCRLLEEGEEVRNRLVEANLGLVVNRAQRFLAPGTEMADLRSEGNYALVRAVGTFDFSQNVRFSTYACTALDRTFVRLVRRRRVKDGAADSAEDPLAAVVDYRAAGPRRDAWREELREQVPGLLQHLGERERLVIEKRYGLDGAPGPATLKEVGEELDVSLERVRQLEKKALERLKDLAIQQGLEPFEE